MATNKKNLEKAKLSKNDEFYTLFEDIENECENYIKHFKNKVILLPCDDPNLIKGFEKEWPPYKRASQFWVYFHNNFNHLKLRKVIATHYNKQGKAYYIEYSGGNDKNINYFHKVNLKGNGDFRTDEIKNIFRKSDIIVTNPPFSLFREFLKQIMDIDKKFLILGNKNAFTYKRVFKYFEEGKIWTGYTSPKKFRTLDMETGDIRETKKVQGLTRWFTNLDIKKREEFIDLYEELNSKKHIKFDNYDAINVDFVSDIPCNYYGELGVPITFLDKYNPKQFEIIRFRKGIDDKDLKVNGKNKYLRIIIKNKKKGC